MQQSMMLIMQLQPRKIAFKSWSASDVKIRAQYLRAIGDQLKKNAEHIGKIETIDSGKLLKETKFQAEYMKDYFYYYAELAEKMENTKIISDIDKPDMEVIEVSEQLALSHVSFHGTHKCFN